MLSLPAQTNVYLCAQPVDLRKSRRRYARPA